MTLENRGREFEINVIGRYGSANARMSRGGQRLVKFWPDDIGQINMRTEET
jgi:hypothetical protein